MILFVCIEKGDIIILSIHNTEEEMFSDDIFNRFPNGTIKYHRENGIPDKGYVDISKWNNLRFSIIDTQKVINNGDKDIILSSIVQKYRDDILNNILNR